MKTFKIHLIRHGMTDANLYGQYIGNRTDLPLCPQGVTELMQLKEEISYPDIEKLYADDMKMAVEIAKQVTRVRCILSPAAASYGFYKNFEERGSHFKALLGF